MVLEAPMAINTHPNQGQEVMRYSLARNLEVIYIKTNSVFVIA